MPDADIAIIGAACRLPGAPDEAAFAHLLAEGRCAVTDHPEGRWNVGRFLHPRAGEPGFSYSFAGGYLPNPFDFDPAVFGMSPREAAQVDPQQRLLAEVVWEALEDARLAPSTLAGTEVGVYVGASSLDHGNLHGADPAAIESHFMTGNTLSVIANRLSYLFDWRGPSFTVDTACSSSLVALSQALSDLRRGRIDTAVVAGVNLLLTPASFIGFARAAMLSPSGLCRPFSADGDGYVRAEGAVAFVLRRADLAAQGAIRAFVVAADVNSDGRTPGIALPGVEGQKRLLSRLYHDAGLRPDDVAFVEAHGTGTRVGDPIEALALGETLGRGRTRPLPIGSVKSNIGHLEPASGVAGMLKAIQALETRRLPASLHLDTLNPAIDFDALNLRPAIAAIDLDADADVLHCGVSSFGFGGTNAHVVLRSVPRRARTDRPAAAPEITHLVLSAATREALSATARAHARVLETGVAPARLAAAVASGREMLRLRAVAPLTDAATLVQALDIFAATGSAPGIVTGSALSKPPRVCFVYAGNGAQWVGMGRAALRSNRAFAARFAEVDAAFAAAGCPRPSELIDAPDLAEKMRAAHGVQALLFAIQSSLTAALAVEGLVPDLVLGHSIGELAAADAAGALDLADAVRIIAVRASCQEDIRGTGLMAVFAADRATVAALLDDLATDDIEIAADNGPASVTVSGGGEAVRLATREGRRRRIASRILDIEYPFHSRRLDRVHDRFLAGAGVIASHRPTIAMVSTVDALHVGARPLDAGHWWRNLRRPVLFRQAIETAVAAGAELFVEIGPRPILVAPITQTLKDAAATGRVIPSLAETDERDGHRDPIRAILARAIANGFPMPHPTADVDVDRSLALPGYPWQRRTHRFQPTSEALDVYGARPRHPLIGGRLAEGQPEWRTLLDTEVVPYLADHRVGGEVVVPGAALAEMILAVARDLTPEGPIGFEDLDILHPLALQDGAMREISVRHGGLTADVEVWSRPRLGPDEWTLHARGRLLAPAARPSPQPMPHGDLIHADAVEIYGRALQSGLDYGPAFRLVRATRRDTENVMEIDLAPAEPGTGVHHRAQILHPASLDATLHGLFQLGEIDPTHRRAWLPIRFGRLSVWRDHAEITNATLVVEQDNDHALTVTVWLRDVDGAVVARLDRALLRAVTLSRSDADDGFFHLATSARGMPTTTTDIVATVAERLAAATVAPVSDGWLLLRGHMRATARRVVADLADARGDVDLDGLVASGRVASEALPYLAMLLDELTVGGLVQSIDGRPRLDRQALLPQPEAILATFAADWPSATADLLLAGLTAAGIDDFLTTGRPIPHRSAILTLFAAGSLVMAPVHAVVAAAAAALMATAGVVLPHIVVAEPGAYGILAALLPAAEAGRLRLTVAGDDADALDRLASRLSGPARVAFLDLSATNEAPDADLVVAVPQGGAPLPSADLFPRLASRLRAGGAFLAAHPPSDPLIDFLRGSEAEWFAGSRDPLHPIGRQPTATQTRDRLTAAGCGDIRTLACASGDVDVFLAAAPPAGMRDGSAIVLEIATLTEGPATDLGSALAARIAAAGGSVIAGPHPTAPDPATSDIVVLTAASGDDRTRVEQAIAVVRDLVLAVAPDDGPRLWLVTRGLGGATVDPVAEALWSFGRVVLNERAGFDLRLVDIAADLPDATAAAMLCDLITAPGDEREIRLDATGRSVLRIRRGLPDETGPRAAPEAMALALPRRGMFEHFQWRAKARVAPGPGEIEVEIAATGLNFRDVMLAMGLLDDDVLDDGLAGSVFGFECAGRVVAVGAGVATPGLGDMVFGFAAEAFATHVTASQAVFATLPPGLTPEAAAAVSVAFLTSWYGLIELAHLAPGERVLIHGAAGSVGLAAIQIAKARGAEVVATVSAPDKRALVELFGADHVYDSRSLAFADAVRDDLGGVDVVLNSLAGEAMRAGLKCLKPFGRFIELGKRDYVANTEIGLRPFRRNLTYFGVDLDQLLRHAPAIATRGLAEIVDGLVDGRYTPLPHLVFEADGIGRAFRLMQSAGHAGKIVVRPPRLADQIGASAPPPPYAPGPGVQLVVGGTTGFGLATALWLADKGATRIVVASRRGRIDGGALVPVEALRAAGVTFAVETVDVTSATAVDALVARVTAAHGPITAVFHTAMVLDDALLADLDADRMAAVLAPKIDGARHLDRATRDQPLEHFVLYASAAALVGNPGQSAYVAANGWLQGLARRRRAEGRPALAVAWGAIADTGVLTRAPGTADTLERVTGVVGMPAHEALNRLERLLCHAPRLADPVVVCAEFRHDGLFRNLPILATPTFRGLFDDTDQVAALATTDLAALIAGKSDAQAQQILAELVAEEIARILRLSKKEVDLDRPLDEIGMDSLMSLELRMSIEAKYGVELPLVSITSVKSLRDVGRRMLQSLRHGDGTEVGAVTVHDNDLIAIHGGDEAAFAGLGSEVEELRNLVPRVP